MKLIGIPHPNQYNAYYITLILSCRSPYLFIPITFLIDTGCSITTISFRDSFKLNIKLNNLSRRQTLTANGVTNVVSLSQCGLMYVFSESVHMDIISSINISIPQITQENYKTMMTIPSLLGMDYLNRYKLQFLKDRAILEK